MKLIGLKVLSFRVFGGATVEGKIKNIKGDVVTLDIDGKEEQHTVATLYIGLEDYLKKPEMNSEEQEAFNWAIKQQFQSIAARCARTLAKYINRFLENK